MHHERLLGVNGHQCSKQNMTLQQLESCLKHADLQLNREEKRRLEAEDREYEAQADLEICQSALHGAQQEKGQLEAELSEAAADLMEQHALQDACREVQRACQVTHPPCPAPRLALPLSHRTHHWVMDGSPLVLLLCWIKHARLPFMSRHLIRLLLKTTAYTTLPDGKSV